MDEVRREEYYREEGRGRKMTEGENGRKRWMKDDVRCRRREEKDEKR